MKTEKPLVDNDYPLQKEDCKGACTWVEFLEIPTPKTPFGMLKVKGRIDDYEFSGVNLLPVGNGHQFMRIKTEIKKKIGKDAPATVHVTLYEDNAPISIPEELLLCMKEEDGVLAKFEKYTDSQKKAFIDWINSAKTEQTRIDRIAKIIVMVQNGEKR